MQEDVLEVLLSLGANASAADNIGNTGLHVAAEFGRVSAATQPMGWKPAAIFRISGTGELKALPD